MAVVKAYNLARMTTATTGTGTLTLGVAVAPFLTFAQAGVSDGNTVCYSIIDGTANSEIGTGVYTSSGTTMTRVVTKSTNSNSAINLSGTAQVLITPRAEDLFGGNLPGSATNDDAAAGNVGEYIFATSSSPALAVTISNASPGIVTWASHGMSIGAAVNFTTTGGLPTGVTVGTTYYVSSQNYAAGSFAVSTTVANALSGTSVNTSSAGSGTHTGVGNAILTTATAKDLTGVSLTPGDWDVWGSVAFSPNSSTTSTTALSWISTASATPPSAPNGGAYNSRNSSTPLTGDFGVYPVGAKRVSLSTTTPVYLSAYSVFAVSTNAAYGFISARRVR